MKCKIICLFAISLLFSSGCGKKSDGNPIQPEPTPEEQKAIDDHKRSVDGQEREQRRNR